MSNELTTTRDALKQQVESLHLKQEIAVLEDTLKHHEMASNLIESWGDLIDPLDSLRSEPEYFNGQVAPLHTLRPDDHKHGDNYPFFRTEQELRIIQGLGEWIATTDSTAIGALETLTSYVIHTGFVWTAVPEEGAPDDAASLVQDIIDDFFKRESWSGDLDRELFKRTRKHGERFLRIKIGTNGEPTCEVIEPSWITEPLNPRDIEEHEGLEYLDWKYGIATTLGNPNEVHGYFVVRNGDPGDWEFVPAEEMSHVKINVDRNVKRGLSDYYANGDWITEASQLLDRILKGGKVQASIALIREWGTKASSTKIGSAADGMVEFNSRLPAREGTSAPRTVPTERFFPGKVVDVKGAAYHPGPMGGSNAPVYIDIVGAAYRKAANRWQMPEFLYTGDASNANYASTLVSVSPFVRFCETIQTNTVASDKNILWRVVKLALEYRDRCQEPCGYTFEELQALVDLDADVPGIAVEDKKADHEIRRGQYDAGLLSKESWSSAENLDYKEEQRKRATEPKPVGDFTNSMNPQTAALSTALESAQNKDEAWALLESMRGTP